MKKITSFLLACLTAVLMCTSSISALDIQPRWENTGCVVLAHTRIGTTAHVNIDLSIDEGATLRNVAIRLIAMQENPSRVVKTWTDPEWTIDYETEYNFYDTFSPVTAGKIYRLAIYCEVWRNGVMDEISLYKDVQY